MSNMSQVNIYALAHPTTGAIRYVGQTTLPLPKRLAQHIYDGRHFGSGKYPEHTARTRWLASLAAEGLRPSISLLCVAAVESERAARAVEREWMEKMRAGGCELLNVEVEGEAGDACRAKRGLSVRLAHHCWKIVRDLDAEERWLSEIDEALSGCSCQNCADVLEALVDPSLDAGRRSHTARLRALIESLGVEEYAERLTRLAAAYDVAFARATRRAA